MGNQFLNMRMIRMFFSFLLLFLGIVSSINADQCKCSDVEIKDSKSGQVNGHCKTGISGKAFCFVSSISSCGDKKPVPKSSGMFYSFNACKTRNNQDGVEKQGQLEESGICLLPFQTLCLLSFKLDFAGVNIGNNARTGMNTETTTTTRRPKGRRSKKPKKEDNKKGALNEHIKVKKTSK